MRIPGLLLAPLLAMLAGCSLLHGPQHPDSPTGSAVHPFSANPEGLKVPQQWRPYILSRLKRATEFMTVNYGGTVVVKAVADSSASGLSQKVSLTLDNTPFISWRWKVSDVPTEANNRIGPDDAAARVVVAFDGDRDKLDFEDKVFAERVKALSGNDVPYATLMYIWSNKDPVDTLIENKYSSRIKMIVTQTGGEKLDTWVKERRNLRDDYRRAFGEDPGKVISVGIMSDTDNTGVRVVSHYGDILFERP